MWSLSLLAAEPTLNVSATRRGFLLRASCDLATEFRVVHSPFVECDAKARCKRFRFVTRCHR